MKRFVERENHSPRNKDIPENKTLGPYALEHRHWIGDEKIRRITWNSCEVDLGNEHLLNETKQIRRRNSWRTTLSKDIALGCAFYGILGEIFAVVFWSITFWVTLQFILSRRNHPVLFRSCLKILIKDLPIPIIEEQKESRASLICLWSVLGWLSRDRMSCPSWSPRNSSHSTQSLAFAHEFQEEKKAFRQFHHQIDWEKILTPFDSRLQIDSWGVFILHSFRSVLKLTLKYLFSIE